MHLNTSRCGDTPLQTLFPATAQSTDGASRLKSLYPFVEANELPQAWSPKDKANYISLSENNLKVHYKGVGKGHKDAAAVRATHPIPSSCLLYYFEIKIISKGRDGYMGIGLAAQGVSNQRLPGWDKQSYGYHGDDGHSFCSSGTGQPYGPTFTTGDVIGCAYNLVENSCFYTKNGLNLGIAFADLPHVPLYPTVGLQTPGEEVEANFGTEPFHYDIADDVLSLRQRITASVINHPVKYNEWQTTVHKLVQSWLVHNGYCSTAESFSTATKQEFKEDVINIKQRLKIQQLVLSGKIGEAISITERLYPDVLKENPNLMFALKCRNFIEMISGLERDQKASFSPPQSSSVAYPNYAPSASSSPILATNGSVSGDCNGNSGNDRMETDEDSETSNHLNNSFGDMPDISPGSLNKVLEAGKELHQLSQALKRQNGSNEQNKKMLQEAFSLLAYSNPKSSPVGWQLESTERENVCQQLNNAIVVNEMGGSTNRPPLETIIQHSKALLRLNGQCGAWLIEQL